MTSPTPPLGIPKELRQFQTEVGAASARVGTWVNALSSLGSETLLSTPGTARRAIIETSLSLSGYRTLLENQIDAVLTAEVSLRRLIGEASKLAAYEGMAWARLAERTSWWPLQRTEWLERVEQWKGSVEDIAEGTEAVAAWAVVVHYQLKAAGDEPSGPPSEAVPDEQGALDAVAGPAPDPDPMLRFRELATAAARLKANIEFEAYLLVGMINARAVTGRPPVEVSQGESSGGEGHAATRERRARLIAQLDHMPRLDTDVIEVLAVCIEYLEDGWEVDEFEHLQPIIDALLARRASVVELATAAGRQSPMVSSVGEDEQRLTDRFDYEIWSKKDDWDIDVAAWRALYAYWLIEFGPTGRRTTETLDEADLMGHRAHQTENTRVLRAWTDRMTGRWPDVGLTPRRWQEVAESVEGIADPGHVPAEPTTTFEGRATRPGYYRLWMSLDDDGGTPGTELDYDPSASEDPQMPANATDGAGHSVETEVDPAAVTDDGRESGHGTTGGLGRWVRRGAGETAGDADPMTSVGASDGTDQPTLPGAFTNTLPALPARASRTKSVSPVGSAAAERFLRQYGVPWGTGIVVDLTSDNSGVTATWTSDGERKSQTCPWTDAVTKAQIMTLIGQLDRKVRRVVE